MILQELLEKPYEEYTIRSTINLKCDYCGKIFQRVKKSIKILNKHINKDSCGNKDCKQKKQEEICLLLYGKKNYFQSSQFKILQEKTNLEKYGTKEYLSSKEFQQKRKKSLIKNYGVESPLQSEELKKKQQETCLNKYGVENYSQTNEYIEKRNKTNLEKYGFINPIENPDCLEKRKKTNKNKFGKENYTQTEEYKENTKQTCLEKYDVDNYAETEEFKEKYNKTCIERYGIPNTLCLIQSKTYGKTQKEIQDWLNSFGFDFQNNYSILKNQEIDLYDKNLNLGIEYCGLFWHNEMSPQPRMRRYHYDKYLGCKKENIRLITIFEDEWKNRKEQCKNFLLSIINQQKTRLFARKCEIRESNKKEFGY